MMSIQDQRDRPGTTGRRGGNQTQVRSYNERLMLQLIRSHPALTKADATRATGLSANAVSVIFRALEEEGLVLKGEPIRGRIGQPSTPMRINPDAQRYVTVKIGRHSLELAVVDFAGEIRAFREIRVPYPTPGTALAFVKERLSGLLRSAGLTRGDIAGLAIAMPFELWSWTAEMEAPPAEMEQWRDFDAVTAFGEIVPWPVLVENDGTAACRAECVFGPQEGRQDWLYFFVGTFIGGGVVLNGSVFPGRRGNAGGFGPMRVPGEAGGARLVDHASLIVLERAIAAAGRDPAELQAHADRPVADATAWAEVEPQVAAWITRAGCSLAHAIVSSLSVLDFEAAVIDGAFPASIRDRLVAEVTGQMQVIDLQGVTAPEILAGHIGRRARVKGAAAALISRDYLIDQNTLMRG